MARPMITLRPPGRTGDIFVDAERFLVQHGCPMTAAHSRAVADVADDLATRFGIDREAAHTAAWLHDVSAVIPDARRCEAARQWHLAILPEEAALPMILHQKLSAWMAQNVFAVGAPGVLQAIRCHTTLRAGATALDMVIFVADKIAWDQPGTPPYLDEIQKALGESLPAAAAAYLAYLWAQRDTLPVLHPWLAAAYADLCGP